tara:strand:+ start:761 stop:1951 length:1191 start_codon:yes stop_codon:yes gene_type:complete
MARNFYFSEKVRSEIDLYEDLVIESLKIYGQDVYYLPRTLVNEDTLLGGDPTSQFASANKIEMYIENIEGFDGEGDLFTRFGVEIRDEVTLVVAKRRFETQVKRMNNTGISLDRPAEGDLVFIPLTKKMFEIQHVEHEQPFYQIENLPVFKLRCTLFEYTGEDLDTSIDDIQSIEQDGTYQYKVRVVAPKLPVVTAIMDSSRVASLNLVSGGNYFTSAPTVRFIGGGNDSAVPSGDSATATATIDSSGAISALTLTDSGANYTVAPTFEFVGGSVVDSDFSIGDIVEQTLASGVKMTGEIQRVELLGDSSRVFHLAHVGASDGLYHSFVASYDSSRPFTTSTLINKTNNTINGMLISSVTEDNKISQTEQNTTFSSISDDFLDFTENNPFGDPENQ